MGSEWLSNIPKGSEMSYYVLGCSEVFCEFS